MGRDAEEARAPRRPAEDRGHGHLPGEPEIQYPGPGPAPHGPARSLRRAHGGSLRVAQSVVDRGALMRRAECPLATAKPDALLRARRLFHRAVSGLSGDVAAGPRVVGLRRTRARRADQGKSTKVSFPRAKPGDTRSVSRSTCS